MAGNKTSSFYPNLRVARIGLLLSLLAILFGFGLGGLMGGLEDVLKSGLAARAETVRETAYGGDAAKIKPVLDKSWTYYKRAHMHGAGIGNSSVVLILLIAALRRPGAAVRFIVSLGLGAGAFGYSLFWLLAGRLAPVVGGTGQAKEALEWLAVPSAGLLILGLIATVVLVAMELFGTRDGA